MPTMPRKGGGARSKQPPTELVVTAGVYPSGTSYFMVLAGDEVIGHIHRADGGFVPLGCKKPRTIEGAARDVVRERLRDAERAVAKFSALVELPVTSDAVDPHVADTGKPSPRDPEIDPPDEGGGEEDG